MSGGIGGMWIHGQSRRTGVSPEPRGEEGDGGGDCGGGDHSTVIFISVKRHFEIRFNGALQTTSTYQRVEVVLKYVSLLLLERVLIE